MTTRNLSLKDSPTDTGYLQWKDAQRTYQVELGAALTIGREPGNNIVLDEFASARHARIEKREKRFVLRDLRSRNGTLVNGTRVIEVELSDGDRICIGSMELTFSIHKEGVSNKPLLSSKNLIWNVQLNKLPGLAESPFPILITGPSGTGKDILAQHLHRLSPRHRGPFVGVNCGSLTESLVESELFGHVRGSFTGATNDRKGAFEAARGGTLFLDEVGDLPMSLQPKLLRALENNQIRPVGSDRSVQTDVRIVAATHRNLKQLVSEGRFRADLYFRLHVLTLHAPALKDRLEDFEDLLYGFARELRVRFSHAAIEHLKTHEWPGNIRELKNTVSRANALYGSSEITDSQVPFLIDLLPHSKSPEPLMRTGRSVIQAMEMELIKERLIANQGNQRRTAIELGMAKSTLHDRIRSYGLDFKTIKPPES
jgi:DNA-binding NtrC family response regulator